MQAARVTGKVVAGATMSLDGYMSDANGSLEQLYPDLAELGSSEFLQEEIRTTGAVVMGRRAYDMANGDLTGYEFQVPIFVVTHRAPDQPPAGQNERLTVTFVSDGVQKAVELARAAAGDKNVMVIGGASTAQQLLRAGWVDELHIGFMPVLLGGGLRFFDNLDPREFVLEKIGLIETGARTDFRFRVTRTAAG